MAALNQPAPLPAASFLPLSAMAAAAVTSAAATWVAGIWVAVIWAEIIGQVAAAATGAAARHEEITLGRFYWFGDEPRRPPTFRERKQSALQVSPAPLEQAITPSLF